MKQTRSRRLAWAAMAAVVVMGLGLAAHAASDAGPPGDAGPPEARKSVADFIRDGGPVGYVIIFLSFVGLALVVDALLNLQAYKLMPPPLAEQMIQLARQGRVADLLNVARTVDCMLGRIVVGTLGQGRMSLADVQDTMQEQGEREVTRLQQRVTYIGFIAAIAPMLGLLGTVTGMIQSFNVLGVEQGAARPDELAKGISEALVTTCMGLVVAVPLMFFHIYFRGRVTRIGQDAAGYCERLVRTLTDALSSGSGAAAGEGGSEAAGSPGEGGPPPP